MAVRTYAVPRRRREPSLPPVTVTPVLADETLLLERTEQLLDEIDAVLAGGC